ncbi:EpsG family protein [Chryseobacterium sp. TY4]
MFDWIPVSIYTPVHYYMLFVIVLFVLVNSCLTEIDNQINLKLLQLCIGTYVIILILYMGLRPISGTYFGDTANYAIAYYRMQAGEEVKIEKDYAFNYFMKWCSGVMNVSSFYLLLDVLYVMPMLLFSKKFFGQFWWLGALFMISSFSFWAAGTNGLRNGLGTSIFLLGLFFYRQKWLLYPLFALSYFMHASLVIPIAAFVISGLYKNPKVYLAIWLLAIPLSLAGGSAWATFFANLGFAEDRTQGYLTGGSDEYNSQFSQSGFRWDFLLYSASAIFAGWYFILKKKITDKFYIHLFGIYCIANAFWILVITAAFSNRFAYLSWFLMPVVIAYPMFRYKIWPRQFPYLGIILFLYYLFTFIMNIFVYA